MTAPRGDELQSTRSGSSLRPRVKSPAVPVVEGNYVIPEFTFHGKTPDYRAAESITFISKLRKPT
jgi:hypothetical protein